MSNPAYKGTKIPGLDPDLDPPAPEPVMSPMSAEQKNMISQMSATPRQDATPEEAPPPMPMQVPPPQMQSGGMTDPLMQQFAQKFKQYSNQHDASLAQLQQYMKDYQNLPQKTDYQALAAFAGNLPQNKNSQLLEAAKAGAPETAEKRQENIINQQQALAKQEGEQANMMSMAKILQGQNAAQLRQQNMAERMAMQQSRLDNQKMKEARTTVNNDGLLKVLTPRLEGAAKIGELIDSAKTGKVVSNQALLGQINAEIARLETGSQSPGLHAGEKTELVDRMAQLGAMRDSITGKPQDAVRPEVLQTNGKMVDELKGSYMRGIDSRMDFLRNGMEPQQAQVVDDKHSSLKKTYSPRFGGWDGIEKTKIYQGKTYKMQGDHWVEEK